MIVIQVLDASYLKEMIAIVNAKQAPSPPHTYENLFFYGRFIQFNFQAYT